MHFPHRVALKMPDSQTLVMSQHRRHTLHVQAITIFVRRRQHFPRRVALRMPDSQTLVMSQHRRQTLHVQAGFFTLSRQAHLVQPVGLVDVSILGVLNLLWGIAHKVVGLQ